MLNIFKDFFEALRVSVELVMNVLELGEFAPKNHGHPYLQKSEIANHTEKLRYRNDFALKGHEHNYISTNPYIAENVRYLRGYEHAMFAHETHDHDDVFQKKMYWKGHLIAKSARGLHVDGMLVSPKNVLAFREHTHHQYYRYDERVIMAKRFRGVPPSQITPRNHNHDGEYVTKDSPYKPKDATAERASRLTFGRLKIVKTTIPKGVLCNVTHIVPDLTVLSHEMFAYLGDFKTSEVTEVFRAYSTSNVRNKCRDSLYQPLYEGSKAKTKYLILFMPSRAYKKLQPYLHKTAVQLVNDNEDPHQEDILMEINTTYRLWLDEAERKDQSIANFVEKIIVKDKFWLPLVPPSSNKSVLGIFDQLIYLIGIFIILIVSLVSLIVTAVINFILDSFAGIFESLGNAVSVVPLVGSALAQPFYNAARAIRELCIVPVGVFRTLGSGLMVPVVFVQKQRGDPPTHWLVPDRVYGVSVISNNVYNTVNKHKITVEGIVKDVAMVAGGYFSNLDEAIQKYCRRFEVHYPVPFYFAGNLDGQDVTSVSAGGFRIYIGRYVKFWDPRKWRFGAMGAGNTIVAFNSGMPYTIVLIQGGD